MGGEREEVIEQKSKKSKGEGGEIAVKNVRIHESGGEFHFHDDESNLKVAVPVDVWYAAFSQLVSKPNKPWTFVDISRKTYLIVETVLKSPNPKKQRPKATLDIEITIGSDLQISPEFEQISKCTLGGK